MDGLKEFLVSIGWGIDEKSERDWNKSLGAAAKTAVEVAAALTAAASAVVALVQRTSIAFDSLSFAAQRAGTSVENFKALAYSLQQVGVGGSAAGRALDGLAQRLRLLPSTDSIINLLGVKTRIDGKARDTTDVILDVVDALSGTNYVQAVHTAGQLGISEQDYNQLRLHAGQIRQFMQEYKALAAGVGLSPDDLGISSTIFMTAQRLLTAQFQLTADLVAMSIGPILQPLIDGLSEWLKDHRQEVVAFVEMLLRTGVALLKDLNSLIEALKPLLVAIVDLAENATGKNGAVAALEAIGGAYMASLALRMLGPINLVSGALAALAALLVIGKASAAPLDQSSGEPDRAPSDNRGGIFARARAKYRSMRDPSGAAYRSELQPKGAPSKSDSREVPGTAGSDKASVRYNNPGAQYPGPVAADYGSTTHAIIGGGHKIAIFEDKVHGAAAQFGLLRRNYAGMKLGDLINKWSGGNSSAAYTNFMAKRLNISPGTVVTREMLDDPVFAKAFFRAQTQWEGGGTYPMTDDDLNKAFEIYQRAEKEREVRRQKQSSISVPSIDLARTLNSSPLVAGPDEHFAGTMEQDTVIVVRGDADPNQTAHDVSRAQQRVNTGVVAQAQTAFA